MKYTGDLGDPIASTRLGLFSSEEDAEREAHRIVAKKAEKIPALFQVHGVEVGDWPSLALALANAHVPGFRVGAPAGRPAEWTAADDAEFRLDVDAALAAGGKTVDRAIETVAKQDRWSKKAEKMKTTALRQHYYRANDAWIRLVSDARAYQTAKRDD